MRSRSPLTTEQLVKGNAMHATSNGCGPGHLIRFASLFREGYELAFPCDTAGHVDLDAMSERARENYFFARAMIGREFATPKVVPAH